MKLTCPACSAQYTIATERLEGRRVKVRCRRCGESFPVDSAQQSGEVYARQSESRRGRDADLFAGVATAGAEGSEEASATSATSHAAPLTGQRHESSVLFSLAALAKQAPAAPASKVTESSALIDIRALVSATSKAGASAARADDIMNLSGGGAFAPLFAPPVTYGLAENEAAARGGKGPFVVGAMALVVVAMVGAVALVGVRSRSSAPAVTAATAVRAPTDVPSGAATASSTTLAMAGSEPPPAPAAPLGVVTPVTTTSSFAPPARSGTRANDPRAVPQVPTPSTPSAAPKCCPGESEIACHMRISAGAACSAEPPAPAVTAPPFDRLAAARALGINVASCKRGDGPTGAGHVKVTFQASGSVSAVEVEAPYGGTATGACVAQRYRGASVPAFAGGPLSVGKTFGIE